MTWLSPVEFNVVIDPDSAEKRSKGGIIIPDTVSEREELAMMTGTLEAVSPLAFNYDTWPPEAMHQRPKPGDRVLYAKYAGTVVKEPGTGREVRICKDKDVIAVLPKEQAHV